MDLLTLADKESVKYSEHCGMPRQLFLPSMPLQFFPFHTCPD